jgi:hypothetical protein
LRPVAIRALAVGGFFALCAFACQGPDEYFRNGAVSGTGGLSSSTGGDGTGNSGLGGTAPGTGGEIIATGGVVGTGGVVSTGGTKATGGITGGGGRAGGSGAAGGPGTGGRVIGGGGAGGAGRAGSGGTVSAGGAGGGAAAGKLVIDAYCQSGTSTQAITVYIDVLNNSTTQLALNSVTFRYWYTMGAIAATDTPKLEINYAVIGAMAITSKFVAVSPAVTGANEYLEVGFTKTAPTLALFSDSGQIQLAFHSTGYSSMFSPMQAMDYSFQKCGAGQSANTAPFNPAPTITGYIDGVLAYGTEPM